jgi:hypothetical protein
MENLEKIATVGGMLIAPMIVGGALCSQMYESGIVSRMYSENIIQRIVGNLEALPYQLGWIAFVVPTTLALGAVVGSYVGRKLDKLVQKAR